MIGAEPEQVHDTDEVEKKDNHGTGEQTLYFNTPCRREGDHTGKENRQGFHTVAALFDADAETSRTDLVATAVGSNTQ